MNTHTLKVLEFDRIREFLKSFAASAGAVKRCAALVPERSRARVQALLDETTEMRREIDENQRLPLAGIHDIAAAVSRARIKNFYLEPKMLVHICDTLETAGMLKKYFACLEETRPNLFRLSQTIVQMQPLIDRVRKCVSPQGEILDSASALLAEIRARLKNLRVGIIKTLEQLLDDEQKAYAIQDDFITLRNNRYVIPVRSDSKTAVPGVVHDQSQSKATFFVEPLPVVTMNNELQVLRREEYYEEIRILTELTSLVASEADTILLNLSIAESIDVIHARALFSKAYDGQPAILSDDSSLELRQCRHPILLSRFVEELPQQPLVQEPPETITGYWEFNRPGVVPVDLMKSATTSTLVVTGANAGGKTVAMKTLGLFVLMTQAGMHIPVSADSKIPVFDRVFADIGDEQNIEASLSTFSAHMFQINNIVASAGRDCLVLLDELGSGTDPAEGGSLAVAILDFLRSLGCCTVVTTHLNLLKTYAYGNQDVENVSVAFDPDTYKPLYSLVYGVPGLSNALAIAKNIGIPDQILLQAQAGLEGSDKQIAALIHGLEQTHREILDQKSAFREIQARTLKYQSTIERLCEAMKLQKDKILRNFEAAARKLLRESEDELTKLIREQKRRKIVRPEDDFKTADAAKEIFHGIKRKLHDKFPRTAVAPEPVTRLEVGQQVTLIHLNKKGIVTTVDNEGRKAEITVGTMRVKAGFDEIAAAAPAAAVKPAPAAPVSRQPRGTSLLTVNRVNVIGMRVDEALPVVDKAIDNALVQGTETLEIIHGRGTGRLMQAIHEHLKSSSCVRSFESGTADQGGSGITIAHIK